MQTADLLLVSRARMLATSGEARQRRLAAALSLRQIADAIGVSHSAVWKWENGEQLPRGTAAVEWVRLLDDLERARIAAGVA
jgi:transcriptional regulator with XRE-family HTH domain